MHYKAQTWIGDIIDQTMWGWLLSETQMAETRTPIRILLQLLSLNSSSVIAAEKAIEMHTLVASIAWSAHWHVDSASMWRVPILE